MKRLSLLALACSLLLALAAVPAYTQDMATVALDTMARSGRTATVDDSERDGDALTYSDYTVKGYKLKIFGGWFSGGTYLELPPIDGDRTFVEEGSDRVMGYDGDWLAIDSNQYDAPIKRIESGPTYGATLGIYLADNFHIDLTATYSEGRATTTMRNKIDPDLTFREKPFDDERDNDDEFSVLMGGVGLTYEANDFYIFGMRPFVGFGIGGVINSFRVLDASSGLYFQGLAGLSIDLTRNFAFVGQYQLTTFSFSRDELEYSKQVTYSQAFIGFTLFIDVLPPEIRAAHEAERER